MDKLSIPQKTVLVTVLILTAIWLTGCDCSKKLEAAQQQNQLLNQRVAELEAQLEQASIAAAAAPAPQSESTYLVVQGDTLWSIAEKQLGSGNRYKEILALNPAITEGQPLAIGTKLTLPAK